MRKSGALGQKFMFFIHEFRYSYSGEIGRIKIFEKMLLSEEIFQYNTTSVTPMIIGISKILFIAYPFTPRFTGIGEEIEMRFHYGIKKCRFSL